MATHNGGEYINQQLGSILSQLDENDEIVISDDGSTDDTLDRIKSLNDERIKIHCFTPPQNLPGFRYATLNFENSLKKAKGDYIFLADQDDIWVEDKVKVCIDYLQEYDYVVSDAFVTDANLRTVSNTRFTAEENVHTNKYLALFLSTPYQGSCAAFRMCVLDKSLPFPKGVQSHDRWIGNVAAFYFKSKIIPERLIYYRRHEGTTSNAFGGDRPAGVLKTIGYKLIYVKGLIQLLFKKPKK